MNRLKYLATLILTMVVAVACKNETQPETKTVDLEASSVALAHNTSVTDQDIAYAKAEFNIDGMHCAVGCAKKIEKSLAKTEGVKSATVDFDRSLAMVEYDEAKLTPTNLEEIVKKTGGTYSVKDMKTVETFSNEGEAVKKACKADCKMACCAGKDKSEMDAKTCAENCKKACCAKKA